MEDKIAPVTAAPGAPRVVRTPGDAMQAGIHSDLRGSSQHKQMVSAALHLKKESAGHRSNPTAYNVGKKAFHKLKMLKV